MSAVRVRHRPPSFAKATDGRPSGMPCVDFFCASKNKRSATERAKDALHSLGDGGLMAENWRKTNVLHLHFRSIFHPDQRYIGSTADLKSRLAKHNAGEVPHSSKFKLWKVEAYFAFETKEKAAAFEAYIKTGSGHAFAKRHF